jgi:tetratricopeptide (TPR) repeat protein
LPEIARALGVRGVIEGSVARESGSVRITVQLIDAAEDRHLWAQSYTREEKDVLRLQGEMASAIAREIRIAVSPAEAEALASALPVDPEAHMLLLQARELDRRGSTQREQQQRVTELVDRALALAPGFAAAHAFRGAQIRALATTGYEAATETCPKARAELATALELDPRSVPAQNLDAELRAQCDFDWSGALEVYRNTLEVAPGDALLHGDYAGILSLVGRAEEAIEHSRRAAELDPLNDWIAGRRIAVLIPARRFDEAIAIGRKSLQLAPGSVYLKWQLANALFASGDRAAALDTYLSREVAHPGMNFMVGLLHGVDGRRAEAREVLDFLLERRRQRYVPGSQIGVVCAGMGELDQAFEWLERAYAERDVFLHGIAVDPIFDRVRRDPRGAALVARMGLPAPPR